MKICGNCKYYTLRPHGFGHREGDCHRYPETVMKMRKDFCGEHVQKKVEKQAN